MIRKFLGTLTSDLILYAEFRLYQWIRRNTVDKLTLRSTDSTDIDTDATWQERRDAEIALCNYLDDPTSTSHEILYLRVDSYHPQPVSPLYMGLREAASQGCCLVSYRTKSGAYDRLVSSLHQ